MLIRYFMCLSSSEQYCSFMYYMKGETLAWRKTGNRGSHQESILSFVIIKIIVKFKEIRETLKERDLIMNAATAQWEGPGNSLQLLFATSPPKQEPKLLNG